MANAYNKFDALACSENVGRESNESSCYEHPTIICPQMTVNRVPVKHATVTIEQCKRRIVAGNKCTISCKVLDELRKRE